MSRQFVCATLAITGVLVFASYVAMKLLFWWTFN